MISRISVRWRWLRRKLTRTHWTARLLGLEIPAGEADLPGLILIQIDGLSRRQFERAVEQGQMPFLRKLMQQEHFTLESFYSGFPSTTPAVQGEIFYGVRAAVPSFRFYDRERGKDFSMYDAESAACIEDELERQSEEPLLSGGHAYSNIYRGGAKKTRYCSQDFGVSELFGRMHPYRWLILLLLYFPRIVRIIVLAVIELGLAIVDMLRGKMAGHDLVPELLFVPARVAVCVVLREAIRFRVLLDIARGVRVIQANFLGYDEQSHRRGPDSAFAHWTLLGIDRAIRDFHKTAANSDFRDYELVVHSDHGQEHAVPFEKETGRGLVEAFQEVFGAGALKEYEVWKRNTPLVVENMIDSCKSTFGFNRDSGRGDGGLNAKNQIVVTALGPFGLIYLPQELQPQELADYAQRLVRIGGIPLVLMRGDGESVRAFTVAGEKLLPRDKEEIIGTGHPFLREVTEDLISVCSGKYSGDLMFSGWRPGRQPMTFPLENGAHGGPGSEETHGFLLIPDRLKRWHLSVLPETRERVRGEDLYKIIRHYLCRDGERAERVREALEAKAKEGFRVMTYNIHSCFGVDGKMRPERIARVINHLDPDIVGVQEVDCHRVRSGQHDQCQVIADHLRMSHVFKAMLEEKEEKYGIAVFAKHPIEIVKSDLLTAGGSGPLNESRGAIWAKVYLPGQRPFHFITTHFGLGRAERRRQIEVLLGPDWIGGIGEEEPLVVCGDFNSRARSDVMKRLGGRLRDAQVILPGHRPQATFPSMNPFLRIDHVFVSAHFDVREISVQGTLTGRVASDHLPICVELVLIRDV